MGRTSNQEDENELVPFCKPFRIIELFVISTCFTFLHVLPTTDFVGFKTMGFELLVYSYAAFGALTIIAAVDVFGQMFRHPMHNRTMSIFALLSSVFCLIAAFSLFLQYITIPGTEGHIRVSFVMPFIAGLSVLATVMYAFEAFMIIRLTLAAR